ncbi:MAG: cupredoxin family protein [Pseudomonadota bacterium]
MRRRRILAALLALCAATAHAHGNEKHARPSPDYQAEQKDWGIVGDKRAITRTIAIAMTDDMRFTPDRITVNEGETVRFVAKNRGRMLHEMVIGTTGELKAHAALMAKYPNMEHDEPWMVHVDPGKTGEIVWHFNRAGRFEFACLIPGHYAAGMRGAIIVTQR